MKTKTITLTLEQWEQIANAVEMAQDVGPEGEGWKSDGLSAAHCALDAALVYTPLPVRIMKLCPICGNKRCPKATDERLDCTNSNEPGQPGSDYE